MLREARGCGVKVPCSPRTTRGPEGNVMIAARIPGLLGRVALSVFTVLLVIAPGVAADDSNHAWAALVKGGHVAVIRHGNAPPGYGGDPRGFRVGDCTTQRNLDDIGREQARALGEAFRKHGVRVDRIVSSPICRCLDTGQLMAVGAVETAWALLPDTGASDVRLLQFKELVSSWRGPGTLVLVTHAIAVGRLTGLTPQQAETIVLQPTPTHPQGGSLVGRIALPQ